jgi:glycine betaine/proline transport system ATP-binding protein
MTANIKISIKKLYKIFGPDPEMALQHVKNGVEKPKLLEQHDHVLGLKDINIDILDGQVTVIMGLSGSGKSTLIRHFNRLIEPTDGQILIDGINVMDLSNEELRKMRQSDMSMVFQNFALLPHKTVLENAGTALRVRGVSTEEADLEAKKWLGRVGLTGFEGHYPHQLSGGMQQRVGIARALTSNSAVMLMDEAFSALDPLIRNDMQDLLLELQKELHKTIIFISHDLDEALKLADHLVILKDGEVIQQGEPQHILLNPCDPYIESFVSEINRVRVLRVRSVMQPLPDNSLDTASSVDVNATLEDVISHSGGDTNKVYLVKKEDEAVGTICMKDLVRALVPRVPSQKETITA